jgi:glucose/arabinose dehydrogenase
MKIRYAIFLLLFGAIGLAEATEPNVEPRAEMVAQYDDVIWGFDFVGEDELLLTTRSGKLYYHNLKTQEKAPLDAPQVAIRGQGGLLDVLVHNGDVYLTYSDKNERNTTTALARGKLVDKALVNLRTLFRANTAGNSGRHFGSRLVIAGEKLFMTVGDRGERDKAQDLSRHNGKILRLNLDGTAASGNPFSENGQALPEIWSLGHRNPQGIAVDRTTGELFSVEFGPRGGDELNRIQPGKNYGWPVITYGREYYGPSIGDTHKEGMEQPVVFWVPSISPSGMAFYTGNKIKGWQNNLFIAALGARHLRRLVINQGQVVEQESLFEDLNERVRQVRTGKDGYLYFSTDSGKLFRVAPSE